MTFTTDNLKAAANFRKHKVSFGEAESVFDDLFAVTIDDWQHSEQEPREIVIGQSNIGRLLFVCFVERNEAVRLISAREATRQERKKYENDELN